MATENNDKSVIRDGENHSKLMSDPMAWLNRLRPGCCVYSVTAQYGSRDNQVFVMELEVDEKVFQGIGPSRKRGKIMAAEYALVHLGALDSLRTPVPDQSLEPYCWDDFSADIADGTTSLYYDFSLSDQDYVAEENLMELADEYESRSSSQFAHLRGRSALAVIMVLHPEAEFVELSECVTQGRAKFVMGLSVDGMEFTGHGSSKRLAKARAARDALRYMYRMDFGISDDGTPVYDCDEEEWLQFKTMLEQNENYHVNLSTAKRPVQRLYEYFPDLTLDFVDPDVKPDIASFFVCHMTVNGETHVGTGTNKKEAKNNAAEIALAALLSNGTIAKIEEERRAGKELKKKKNEKEKPKDCDFKSTVVTAVGKLLEKFPNATFEMAGETSFKKRVTAFIFSLDVNEKTYVGVGKSKKLAKADAAEKALRALKIWTEEDEIAKHKMLDDEWDDEEYSQRHGGRWGEKESGSGVRWKFGGRVHGGNWGGNAGHGHRMDPVFGNMPMFRDPSFLFNTLQDPCTMTQQMCFRGGYRSGSCGWPNGSEYSQRGSSWVPGSHGSQRSMPLTNIGTPFKRSGPRCNTEILNSHKVQKTCSETPQNSTLTSVGPGSLNASTTEASNETFRSPVKRHFSENKSGPSSNKRSQEEWNFRQQNPHSVTFNRMNFTPGGSNMRPAGGFQNTSSEGGPFTSDKSRFRPHYPLQGSSDHPQTHYPRGSPQPRFPHPNLGVNQYTGVNQGNPGFLLGNASNSGLGQNSFKSDFKGPNYYSSGQYPGSNISTNTEQSYQITGYQSGSSNTGGNSTSSVAKNNYNSYQNVPTGGFPYGVYAGDNLQQPSDNAAWNSGYPGGYGPGGSYGYAQGNVGLNTGYQTATHTTVQNEAAFYTGRMEYQ